MRQYTMIKVSNLCIVFRTEDAAQAQRTIDLFDGQIVSDVKNEL